VTLAERIPDLELLEKRFQEACEGLIYKPGSIFRIASQYLQNWGILPGPANKDFIDTQSTRSYFEEWRRGTRESNDAIHRAVTGANLPYSNPEINMELGLMATEIIVAMAREKERIVIADIGAGAGDTTSALLDFLDFATEDGSIASRCHFYLLEPSISRLAVAESMLQSHAINNKAPVDYTLVSSNHKAHLPLLAEGGFDMVISNAVCHHMTFPDYLTDFNRMLAPDGAAVIGDWHTVIWSQPAFVLQLLERFGAGARHKEQFEYIFNIRKGDLARLEHALPDHHRESSRMMREFEARIANEFRAIPQESRLFFLEAHESLEDRVAKMADAGFETDLDELRSKHRAFSGMSATIRGIFPKSDFAAVVAAGKIDGHAPSRDRQAIRERVDRAIMK
jgi:SAM-dependent methyltransferase